MKKLEFLSALGARLSSLPEAERQKTVLFYAESIDDRMEDGMSEEEAVDSLGAFEDIVHEIMTDAPFGMLIQSKFRESRQKSTNPTLWLWLVILGSPVWAPLAFAVACVILSVYICVWAVVVSLMAVEASLALCGVGGIIMSVFVAVTGSPLTGLATTGMALVCLGLFLLSFRALTGLCRQFLALCHNFLRYIKGLFVRRKVVV